MFKAVRALLAGGLLLGKRAFVGTAIFAVLCLAGVVWAELNGILVTPLSAYTSWSNLIDGAVILGLTALAVGLLIGDLRASLSRERNHTEALRQAEEKYRGIFENAMEGIFQSTPQGRFLTVNPAFPFPAKALRSFETGPDRPRSFGRMIFGGRLTTAPIGEIIVEGKTF